MRLLLEWICWAGRVAKLHSKVPKVGSVFRYVLRWLGERRWRTRRVLGKEERVGKKKSGNAGINERGTLGVGGRFHDVVDKLTGQVRLASDHQCMECESV